MAKKRKVSRKAPAPKIDIREIYGGGFGIGAAIMMLFNLMLGDILVAGLAGLSVGIIAGYVFQKTGI